MFGFGKKKNKKTCAIVGHFTDVAIAHDCKIVSEAGEKLKDVFSIDSGNDRFLFLNKGNKIIGAMTHEKLCNDFDGVMNNSAEMKDIVINVTKPLFGEPEIHMMSIPAFKKAQKSSNGAESMVMTMGCP